MKKVYKLKKGLDFNLEGAALASDCANGKSVPTLPLPQVVAVRPTDFTGVQPKLVVIEDRHHHQTHHLGQERWMSLSTASRLLPPTQSTIPVQKVPAPTWAGIRSLASKRKTLALTNASARLRSMALG